MCTGRREFRTRRTVAVLAAVVTGMVVPAVAASPAGAAPLVVDALCPTGEINVEYQPGLTLVTRPTTVTVTIAVGPCTSTDPTIQSGHATASGSGSLSCLVGGGGSGTDTFVWNNSETSTVDFSDLVAVRPVGETVGVFTGEVTSGEFAGDNFVGTTEALTLNPLGCLSPTGITDNSGPFTFLIQRPL